MATSTEPTAGRAVLDLGVIAGVAFATAYAGLAWAPGFTNPATFCPANALITAALIRAPYRRWPTILLLGALGVLAAGLMAGGRPWLLFGLSLCSALEVGLAAGTVRRWIGPAPDLTESRSLTLFLVANGLVCPLIALAPAMAVLSAFPHDPWLKVFCDWMGSAALSQLILTVAGLALSPGALAQMFSRRLAPRTLSLLALLAVSLGAVVLQTRLPIYYVVLPVLILIAFQLDLAGGALALLITGVVILADGAIGADRSRLTPSGQTIGIFQAEMFLAVAAISVLLAAAVRGHQRRLTTSLRAALVKAETAEAVAIEHQRWAAMASEIAGVGHWRLDERTRVNYWSEEIFRIHGLDPDGEVPDLNRILDFYHPDDVGLVAATFANARRHGRAFSIKVRLVRPDGEIRYVETCGGAERDGQGRISAVYGALMDLTDSYWAERVLRESEERFRLLAEVSPDIILKAVMDEAGVPRVQYVSPAVERVLGIDPESYERGAATFDLIHPEDAPAVAEAVARQRQLGASTEPLLLTYRVRHTDGRWIWLEGRPSFIADPETGRVTGVISILRDITEKKEAEDAIHRSESLYRLLAENSIDGIVQCDLRSFITYVSPACSDMTGYTSAELVGQRTIRLVHPEDRPVLTAALRAKIASGPDGPSIAVQYRIRRKSGDWLWVEGRPAVNFDPSGAPTSVQDVIRDITERKAAEGELARARAAADAANVAKTEFLANMSHEIRTPLTAIIGFSGLLDETPDLPDPAQLYVRRIVAGGQSLLGVVNDILDFSKLEAGQVALDPQPFDPTEWLEAVLDLVSDQAAKKGLALSLQLVTPLPALVRADPARLRQILLNLLSNAVKFTDAGEVAIRAEFSPQTQSLSVAVTDTGVGVAEAALPRLFERFSQADSAVNRRHGGSGLGLAICRNLVDLMGGDIGVRSVEGEGSTFHFSVPAPVVPEARAVSGDPQAEQDEDQARTGLILLVDDLAENRELARKLLQAVGHRIIEAEGGAEAVRAAKETRFDLILMDIQMPDMDGLAATKAIRAEAGPNQATPIVALSANVLAEQVAQCRAVGMNDHVAKPIRVATLVSAVSHWIARPDDALRESA